MRFKMVIALLLALLFLLPLGANAESFSLAMRWWGSSATRFVEAEEGYYSLYEEYLYFIDKESFEPILLCGRIDCLHNEEENLLDCDAFCVGDNIAFIEDHLYFMGDHFANNTYTNVIFRAEKDGTNRRELMNLDDFEKSVHIAESGTQNGYWFYTVETTDVPEEMWETASFQLYATLYRLDLRKPADSPRAVETWNTAEQGVTLLQVSGDWLYYICGAYEGEKALWRYHLASGEKEHLMNYSGVYNFFIRGETLYSLSAQEGIAIYNVETHAKQVVFAFENEGDKGYISSDGQYFYVFEKVDMQADSAREALVINFDGQILNRIICPEPMRIAFAANEYLLLRRERGGFPTHAIARDELSSHDVQLIPIDTSTVLEFIGSDRYVED